MEQNINEELYHYGVMGMKWGVRKQAHYQNVIARKNKQIAKYAVKKSRADEKYAGHAGRYRAKAAQNRAKAYGMFGRVNQRRLNAANRYDAKAENYEHKSKVYDAKTAQAKGMIQNYNRKISKLNAKHVKKGEAYINSMRAKSRDTRYNVDKRTKYRSNADEAAKMIKRFK